MDFNAEQQAAILSEDRNLLVLAGAGTGKTRTIIGRALHLIQQGTDPSRIVIVTFTRRSANEIHQRLTSVAGDAARKVITGTFHSLCLRVMNSRRTWFGYTDVTLIDRDDQLQLMKLSRGEKAGKNPKIPQAAQLINYYSYARNTNQSARDYLEKFAELDEPSIERVLQIFDAYKARKRSAAYFDYDDILHRFAKVLHRNAEVRSKVSGQYDHVLVDEMQDTNPLQWIILQSLAENSQLFCVGDDAQSIYAFRGADFRNVHSFSERLPNSATLKLRQNYRSTQPILDIANWLLARSPLKFDKSLEAIRGDGIRPRLLDFDSDIEEAEWIADEIIRRKSKGANWAAHMILCRTAYSARPIEAQLIERKIPYRFVGGMGLLQMAHVRDLLSILRIVINHRDELAWMRYLTLWPKIGEVTAARILQSVIPCSDTAAALDALSESLPKRPEIAAILSQVLKHTHNPTLALDASIRALEPLLADRYDRWESRRRDLSLLKKLSANHASVQGFLETYTLDPVSSTEETLDDADEGIVTLITVHSAKGTEADVCFVAAVQPGNYPHTRSLGDDDAIEEERRVLYVGLTRARNELIISRNPSRGMARDSWHAPAASNYFFDSLPNKLVDRETRLFSSTRYMDDDDDDDVIL